MQTDLEELIRRIRAWVLGNRRPLFLLALGAIMLWLLITVRDIALLLVVAYTLAVLIDPLVNWLVRRRLGRGLSAFLVMFGIITASVIVLLILLPPVINQYINLI